MVNGNKKSKKGGKMKVSNVSGDLIGIYTVYIYITYHNGDVIGIYWDLTNHTMKKQWDITSQNQADPKWG